MSISLDKKGDSQKIILNKESSDEIIVNLKWDANIKTGFFKKSNISVDLDLACMYRLKDGTQGCIQAVGDNFGSRKVSPFIFLDGDDRDGSVEMGETMFFSKPEEIELAVIFAFVYSGAVDWNKTGACITLKQGGQPDIIVNTDHTMSPMKCCVIASLHGKEDSIEITNIVEFFINHKSIDERYGFGLNWVVGKK